MKFRLNSIVLVIFLVPCVSARPVNLALRKTCVFSPKPNYELTTDSLDVKQLTDGAVGRCLWYESDRKKTVGWFNKGFLEITIDLDRTFDIGLVKVHTIGGGRSGTEYPEYILGMGSTDGKNFSPVTLADSDGWKSGVQGLAEPKTITLNFNTVCRYVKLLVRPNGYLFFTDEVEVFAADNKCKNLDESFLTSKEAVDFSERLRQLYRNIRSLSIENRNSGVENEKFSEKLSQYYSDLDSLKIKFNSLNALKAMEERFDVLRAEFLRARYEVSWFCLHGDPVDVLRYADIPKKPVTACELNLYQWQKEYSIGAINLVNCSETEKEFSVSISPIAHEGQFISAGSFVSIRRALYVCSKNGGFFADPLVLQDKVPFKIKSGETVQLFIEFNSTGLSSGKYIGSIAILCDGKIEAVPLNIEIAEESFPEDMDFMACTWDYVTDRNVFTKNRSAVAIRDLKEHHTNVTVISPYKTFYVKPLKGKESRVAVSPELENELQLRRHAKMRLFFLALKATHDRFGKDIFATDWKKRFQGFIRDLVRYLKSHGYGYDDYALYPYDERIDDKFVYVANLIREVDPKIKIYANSIGQGSRDIRKVFGLVDIWCPYFHKVVNNKKLLDEIKSHCQEVWCYDTELRRDYLIESDKKLNKLYHRTMPIKAAGLGLKGAGFWTYTDFRDGHYNYYDNRIYGVVYDGKYSPKDCIYESIVPSKRWQLWREGVEDAVALKKHPKLLKELMTKPSVEITSKYLQDLRRRSDM